LIILHISTTDLGGAANSAIRLHKGLLDVGVDSNFLFLDQHASSIPKSNHWKRKKLRIEQRLRRKLGLYKTLENKQLNKISKLSTDYEVLHFPTSSFDITQHLLVQECDIINLHSVAGFLDYSSFFSKVNKPLVWTLHDMHPVMGLCKQIKS